MLRLLFVVLIAALPTGARALDQPPLPTFFSPHDTYYLFWKNDPGPLRILQPLTKAELDKLAQIHTTALQADPGLMADAADLTKRRKAHVERLNAAMIHFDPAVAPLLSAPHIAGTSSSLTSTQMDELHKDRAAASQSDAGLKPEGDDLRKQIEAHQRKVMAKMRQIDPSIEPLLAKLSIAFPHVE